MAPYEQKSRVTISLYKQRLRVYPILKKDSQDEYGDKSTFCLTVSS